MTTEQRTSGLKRIKTLTTRNINLESLIGTSELSGIMVNELTTQIEENEQVIQDLIKATDKRYEFLFNFIGGGWNSEYAFTKEEAQAMALEKYKDSNNCKVDLKTFRVSTSSDYENLLSMFY
jgi:hypothetical protein